MLRRASAQTQTNAPPAPPQRPAMQITAPGMPPVRPSSSRWTRRSIWRAVTIPRCRLQRTLIYQNREQEVTANLRPNPTLSWDAQYMPIFEPDLFSSDYVNTTAQFDVGISYLFERGQKRQTPPGGGQGPPLPLPRRR